MSEQTNIAWCDSTWNWAWGCDRVSPACTNCYIPSAPPLRRAGVKLGDPIVVASEATFNAPLKWQKKPWVCDRCGTACADAHCPVCTCLHDHSFHRRRVFTLSLGDFFNRRNPIGSLTRALHIIWQCQDLDFLICTKRPELFKELLYAVLQLITDGTGSNANFWQWLLNWVGGKAPANIWMGTTVEDQKRADERIPELLKIPAKVRFLSCEPLLEEVNLDAWRAQNGWGALDWVIVGGESGPKARPCNVEWIRSIVRQCKAANVPVFVKQLGGRPYDPIQAWKINNKNPLLDDEHAYSLGKWKLKHPKGGDPAEWPDDFRIRQFPQL